MQTNALSVQSVPLRLLERMLRQKWRQSERRHFPGFFTQKAWHWEPTSPVTVTQEGDIWVYLTRWCAGAGACGQIAAIVINSEVKCL